MCIRDRLAITHAVRRVPARRTHLAALPGGVVSDAGFLMTRGTSIEHTLGAVGATLCTESDTVMVHAGSALLGTGSVGELSGTTIGALGSKIPLVGVSPGRAWQALGRALCVSISSVTTSETLGHASSVAVSATFAILAKYGTILFTKFASRTIRAHSSTRCICVLTR